ncbi:MAG TPA: D-alanyl-D-alanine carboxypeptidase family protein [Acetobacteraceae bacterium]|nr:D-alanyl-D-alanine carboxypeptidase family protein [Acetobacteraceae bacterium]
MPSRGRRKSTSVYALSIALGFLGLLAVFRPAQAQIGSDRYSSIVMDADTGAILQATDADELRHPASLAKLMTLYLTFEALRDRRIALDQLVPVSENAAAMEPTKLGLEPGMRITVEEAILGLVTRSANDAAAALGEMLGGSEYRFAELMTLKARSLGMARTHFTNASGLPDPDAWTTARDMAVLARRLIADFPGYYHYFSTPDFVFRGQVIFNHDTMLKDYPGADGLKTGYTVASGHNLVTSALRDGHRLIGVELGCRTNGERDMHMAQLLNAAFEREGVAPAPLLVAARPRRLNPFVGLIASAQASETPRHGKPVRIYHPRGQAAAAAVTPVHAVLARKGAGGAKVERTLAHGHEPWRAHIIGITPAAAKAACTKHHPKGCAPGRAGRDVT